MIITSANGDLGRVVVRAGAGARRDGGRGTTWQVPEGVLGLAVGLNIVLNPESVETRYKRGIFIAEEIFIRHRRTLWRT